MMQISTWHCKTGKKNKTSLVSLSPAVLLRGRKKRGTCYFGVCHLEPPLHIMSLAPWEVEYKSSVFLCFHAQPLLVLHQTAFILTHKGFSILFSPHIILLRRGVIRAAWWVHGTQPGSTLYSPLQLSARRSVAFLYAQGSVHNILSMCIEKTPNK